MNEFWDKTKPKKPHLSGKEKTGERETGKEGNPRRFPAACEMRKDRKACGRKPRDRYLSRFLSYLLEVTVIGKLLRKKIHKNSLFKNIFLLAKGQMH